VTGETIIERIFAIADIHGCSVALKTLLDAINPRPNDTIVVLGDVIDYGPDIKGVIEQLIGLSGRCRLILLTGNHEEMLFQALGGRDDRRNWENCGGMTTRRCYPGRDDHELIDPDHLRFLRTNCRDYYETEEAIFVHASYYPNQSMPDQRGYTLRWEAVEPARMAPHYSGKTVVAGHTCQTTGEVLNPGFMKVIDTDPSRAGWLTGLDVRSGEVIQANQKGELRKPGAGTGSPSLRSGE
jgi:serine/threonine protein phosphatase 1